MTYTPCCFNRQDYLMHPEIYEDIKLEDATEELTEFNYDLDDLAFELAYTRYRLSKAEILLTRYRKEVPLGHQPHMIDYIVDEFLKICN